MIILFRSILTGRVNSRSINVEPRALATWRRERPLVHVAFPDLSDNDREFLMTGITPAEWNAHMPPEEEED